MGRIIANMVVRNEADHYLEPVLERLQKQVDEIVITDDASDDNTVEICKRYTDHVNIMEEPTFKVHEGRLRQASWDYMEETTKPNSSDFILAIDADEMVYEDRYTMRKIAASDEFDVVCIWFYHMWNEHEYRIDGGWKPHGSTRLFRHEKWAKFKDRALACGSEPTYVAWRAQAFRHTFLIHSGLRMKHLSYVKDEDKQAKYDRYSEIDGGAFHAGSHIQSIVDSPDKVRLEPWKE